MARSSYEVTIAVQRNEPTDDLAGGVIDSWSTKSSGLKATKQYYSYQSQSRGEAGPGPQTAERGFYKFTAPFPDVRIEDRLVETGGQTTRVLFTRRYARTFQVDWEIVK